MSFDLGDYVDVAERITKLKAEFPMMSLQGEGEFIREEGSIIGYLYVARAYRDPTDERPGVGTAFEPIPGKTPYTRDSEVMNAETSAWGRAIVALGFETKKIASANEVRNRQDSGEVSGSGNARTAPHKPPRTSPDVSDQPADGGDPVLTFGKHKGKNISDTPAAYRKWLAGNFEPKNERDQAILEAVKDSLIPF